MRLPIIATALTLALAAPALAADYNGTVGASNPTFAWNGGPGSSVGFNLGPAGGASIGNFFGCVDGLADCEETLIKVEVAGKLTVTAKADDLSTDAIDLYLYPSDANGEYDDSETDLAEGAGAQTTGDEKLEVQATAGYYMAVIRFFDASDDTYKGAATLSGFAAPAPTTTAPGETTTTPAQQTQPPAQQQTKPQPSASDDKAAKKKKLKACQKKAKKKKNKQKRKAALKRCAKKYK